MNSLIKTLARNRLFQSDLDYHLVRASMVLVFLLFGYQKWFEYEAQPTGDQADTHVMDAGSTAGRGLPLLPQPCPATGRTGLRDEPRSKPWRLGCRAPLIRGA